MIEHESHAVAVAVDPGDSLAEGSHEVVHRLEEDVGQDRPFEMSPQPFNQVQARAVRRQPVDFEAIPMGFQPRVNRLCVMEPAVVADQTDLASVIGGDQGGQEGDKLRTAFLVRHRVGDPPGGEVDAAVDDLLFVLARGGNFRLDADRRPQARERRMTMNLDFILEDQGFRRVVFQRFFFKRESCFLAFS